MGLAQQKITKRIKNDWRQKNNVVYTNYLLYLCIKFIWWIKVSAHELPMPRRSCLRNWLIALWHPSKPPYIQNLPCWRILQRWRNETDLECDWTVHQPQSENGKRSFNPSPRHFHLFSTRGSPKSNLDLMKGVTNEKERDLKPRVPVFLIQK